MQKLKNDQSEHKQSILHRPASVVLIAGLLLLIILSVGTAYALLNGWIVPGKPLLIPTAVPVPFLMPADALMAVSTSDNEILVSSDGVKFTPTGLQGSDVAASADGKLAYWKQDKASVQVNLNGKEIGLNLSGSHQVPAWSGDGSLLLLSVVTGDNNSVFRLRTERLSERAGPTMMEIVFLLAAPLVTDPSGNRILVSQLISEQRTRLQTIDSLCAGPDDCKLSTSELAVIPYVVTWQSYVPTTGNIVFSEKNGNIYLFDVNTAKVISLVEDKKHKSRPVVSKDGSHLAYLDDEGTLYIMRMSDSAVQLVSGLKIASVSWVK